MTRPNILGLLDFDKLIKSAGSGSGRLSRYFWMAFLALSDKKTILNFSPLPRMVISPRLKSRYRSREQSSERRRPVEKKVSKIARSRRARRPSPSGASMRRSRFLYSRISI